MPFCEVEEGVGEEEHASNRNSSVKWGRELLMQLKFFGFYDVGFLCKQETFELWFGTFGYGYWYCFVYATF